jgi:hypothetical protein
MAEGRTVRQRLFTVTRDRRPVAVVLAREFADAVGIASRLAAVGSTSSLRAGELIGKGDFAGAAV